ncbi:Crp/Fnr family transcriptional regulator [Anabaena sp. UHCC 0399]|uniref:Crp/Fnr family transcriptional regulator n=1 Tax=Anabaena sp. UHCC 0399 TaxID=3110238 RepID=UPI002B1F0243|nr:Crp/Fnr family transcriptional regulator [Anabaena sp. UHCC 0399]MEA5566166.1 Crp/Fnr family transcriptional regulator [Anabaena sp. UHCC 0399]
MYELLHSFIQQLFPQCQIDLTLVEPLLESRKVHQGEFLFREGDICDFVGLTLKGCLRTFFLKDGKELTLFFHPEQHTLGDYESLRRRRPACFSCQAIADSEVLIVNTQAIKVLETLPDGQKLLRLVVEDLAFQLRDCLLSLYRDSPEQRYVNFLKTEPKLLQRIPQYYLASHLGIEPESLSRLKRRLYHKEIS